MISYLQIENLTKSYGDRILFADVTFGINEGDKVGLIAKNGTGKTTLLNIIAGKEDYDSGKIVFNNDIRVGYLEQVPSFQFSKAAAQSAASMLSISSKSSSLASVRGLYLSFFRSFLKSMHASCK